MRDVSRVTGVKTKREVLEVPIILSNPELLHDLRLRPVHSALRIPITRGLIRKCVVRDDKRFMYCGIVSEHSYTVLFEPAEEGGYVFFCPALPGLVTEGDTFDEARQRAEEAIAGYLESLVKDGQPIPPDKDIALEPIKDRIRVALNPAA
jgi:antitoxin HicB